MCGMNGLVPCGICCYTMDAPHKVVYMNATACNMTGFAEPPSPDSAPRVIELISPDDYGNMEELLQDRLTSSEPVSYERRIFRRDTGEDVWLRGNLDITETPELGRVFLDIFIDITTTHKQLEQHRRYLALLYDSMPCGLAHYTYSEQPEILDLNKRTCRMLGYRDTRDFTSKNGPFGGARLYHSDRQNMQRVLDVVLRLGRPTPFETRLYDKDSRVLCISGTLEPAQNIDGKRVLRALFTDVTLQKEQQRRLSETSERYRAIVESMPGGIGVFKLIEHRAKATYISAGLEWLLGYSGGEVLKLCSADAMELAHPQDREAFRREAAALLDKVPHFELECRAQCRGGGYRWLSVRANLVRSVMGDRTIYAVFSDIQQAKLNERELAKREELNRLLVEEHRSVLVDIDVETAALEISYIASSGRFIETRSEDFRQHVLSSATIHPGHKAAVLDILEKTLSAQQPTRLEYMGDYDGGGFQWYRLFSKCLVEKGKPYRLICKASNIQQEMDVRRRYQEELMYREAISGSMMSYYRINLTTGIVEEAQHAEGMQNMIRTGAIVDDAFMEKVCAAIPDPAQRREFKNTFAIHQLLADYEDGKKSATLEYRQAINLRGDVRWVKTNSDLMQKPDGGDIVAFFYTRDINRNKIASNLIKSVVDKDYDYLCYIDGITGDHMMFIGNSVKCMPDCSKHDYDGMSRANIFDYVVEEEQGDCFRSTRLMEVMSRLDKSESYDVLVNMKENDGSIWRKRLSFAYVDKANRLIVLTRTDVTSVFKEENRRNDTLKQALAAANQSSAAKSEFLSRMSHEIRTPMNAILGLTQLALDDDYDKARVRETLEKIGSSANYLLSLINEILDVAYVESGKLVLKNAPLDIAGVLEDVNALMAGQAKAKGVSYTAELSGEPGAAYYGDELKLRQILINLLTNAIKFTPEGGSVNFTTTVTPASKGRSRFVFEVKDTGIGISEKFMPKLFEPFEQELSGAISGYGGTGLGLSICKSITVMMGGGITAKSEKGKGSLFTAEVFLTRLEKAGPGAGLKVAVVTDSDAVWQSASDKLLAEGAEPVRWEALDARLTAQLKNAALSAVMIDIDVWDGGSELVELRQAAGGLACVMTEFTLSEKERQARRLGFETFIEKPVLPAAVRALLQNAEKQRAKPRAISPEALKGKRILLVEDHPLNIEVAKRLLQKYGMTVEVAVDGLKALEAFKASADGYFDAILMDIRMPVMDGLQASMAIRALEKPDAKTVPIIAMTANAFSDDADRSIKCGMDAHLSKPIDVRLLLSTLERLTCGEYTV